METVTTEIERGTTGAVERLYTPEQAAAYLQINEQTVRRFLREGRLRGFLIGRVWRIPENSLREMLEAMANKPAPEGKDKE